VDTLREARTSTGVTLGAQSRRLGRDKSGISKLERRPLARVRPQTIEAYLRALDEELAERRMIEQAAGTAYIALGLELVGVAE